WNDLWHDDPQGTDHSQFGPGLAKSLYNYMHGVALREPLSFWFDFKTPRATVPRQLIQQAIQEPDKPDATQPNRRLFWLGNAPDFRLATTGGNGPKDKKTTRAILTFYEQAEDFEVKTTEVIGPWLHVLVLRLSADYETKVLLKEAAASFPPTAGSWENFLQSPAWQLLREKGLLLI
ncbi:MAG: hypothetical protein ACRYGH_13525, partial [Janthinobacterium lividum]